MGWTRRGVLASGVAALSGCSVSVSDSATSTPTALDADVDATLGFAGDAMLARGVTDHWQDADPAGLWDGLLDRLRSLDGFVCNLECCVSERGQQWPDKVYYFRADPDVAIPALEAADTSAVNLANNHVLDYREPALQDTIDHLDDAGIANAGAGANSEAAFAPTFTDVGEATVAVLGLTDQWPSYAAGPRSAGTAYTPLHRDNQRTRRLVRDSLQEASEADLVVASLHWGPNWVVAPSAAHQRFARWLVDEGVDVVHGHSAHVLQGVETYRGRPILYDTADIVDDYIVKEELHNDRSALFELEIEGGELAGVRVVPVHIADETVGPADGEVAAWVRERVRTLSGEFGTAIERDGDGLWIPLD